MTVGLKEGRKIDGEVDGVGVRMKNITNELIN